MGPLMPSQEVTQVLAQDDSSARQLELKEAVQPGLPVQVDTVPQQGTSPNLTRGQPSKPMPPASRELRWPDRQDSRPIQESDGVAKAARESSKASASAIMLVALFAATATLQSKHMLQANLLKCDAVAVGIQDWFHPRSYKPPWAFKAKANIGIETSHTQQQVQQLKAAGCILALESVRDVFEFLGMNLKRQGSLLKLT